MFTPHSLLTCAFGYREPAREDAAKRQIHESQFELDFPAAACESGKAGGADTTGFSGRGISLYRLELELFVDGGRLYLVPQGWTRNWTPTPISYYER